MNEENALACEMFTLLVTLRIPIKGRGLRQVQLGVAPGPVTALSAPLLPTCMWPELPVFHGEGVTCQTHGPLPGTIPGSLSSGISLHISGPLLAQHRVPR